MSLRTVLARVPLRALSTTFVVPAAPLRVSVQRPALAAVRAISTTAPRHDDTMWYSSAQRKAGQPSTSLFIGNLPWRIAPEDVAASLSQFGTVQDVRIPTDTQGRPRGFAHVVMADIESAKSVMESIQERPLFFGGRHARIEYAAKETPNAPQEPTTNVMVADFDGDEVSLQEIFRDYVRYINRLHVLRDRTTGESKRLAFIEFYNVDYSAEAVNALNGLALPYGATLKLRYATPRQNTSKSNDNDF